MDANNHPYGGFISNSNTTEAYGIWSEQEQDHSPTFRELKAIHNVIESCAPLLAHRKVKLFSDNQGACTISLIKTDLKLVSDSYSWFPISIRSFVFGRRIRNWKI